MASLPQELENYVYDGLFAVEDGSYWFRVRNDVIAASIERHALPGTFLDVGGGNGFVAHRLQQDPRLQVVLIEPARAGCENARRRGVREIYNGALPSFAPGEQVENIGAFDVIEHVEQDAAFLRDVHARLASRGRLFLTVPAHNWLWSHEDGFAGHHRRYSLRPLTALLTQNGFRIRQAEYFFAFLVPIIFAFRRVPYLIHPETPPHEVEQDHSGGLAARALEWLLRLERGPLSLLPRLTTGASIMVCAEKA